MEKKELEEIIQRLESSNLPEHANWEIYQYGGGPDESFVRANRPGLELFAAQLLRASIEFDGFTNEEKGEITSLDYKSDWIGGDTLLQYVQFRNNEEEDPTSFKESIADKLVPLGCIIAAILILLCFGIGIKTIISWFL